MGPRLLSEKCETCIFRPGNLMHLSPGRLKQMVDDSLAENKTITCHSTLPYGKNPGFGAAVCRGFYDTVGSKSWLIQIVERVGGFTEVDLPRKEV